MTDTGGWLGASAHSSASPETVWAVWTDPSCWVGGPVESAQAHGQFDVGGTYTTRVKGERPLTGTITVIDRPRRWVSTSKSLGMTMTIEHLIQPEDDGTLLTERLQFHGLFAPLVSRLMARRLEGTFSATTAHCASIADRRTNAS